MPMPYETSEWSGYSITAVILVIIAIIMIIVAIVWYEQEQNKAPADRSYTGVTLLFVGGIVFFVIALFVGYSGRSKRAMSVNEYSSQTTNLNHPGYWPGSAPVSPTPAYGIPPYTAPPSWAYANGSPMM